LTAVLPICLFQHFPEVWVLASKSTMPAQIYNRLAFL
jgi:hypothetical protein